MDVRDVNVHAHEHDTTADTKRRWREMGCSLHMDICVRVCVCVCEVMMLANKIDYSSLFHLSLSRLVNRRKSIGIGI